MLVALARSGDKAAFGTAFDRHRPLATALVSRLLGRDEVDDVLQEAAVQSLICLGRLPDPSRFGPWLAGIALNLARSELRRRALGARQPPRPVPGPLTDEVVAEMATAAKVRDAIGTLPEGQRQAVRLFYLDGLDGAEVAATLGIAPSAVKSRLHKARRSLSVRLEDERRPVVVGAQLVAVEVSDLRREPLAASGSGRSHVVVLRERGRGRALPIYVGEPEGRAMAATLSGVSSLRPMTYQLAAGLVGALGGSVTEVRVVSLSESTYIAEVLLDGPSGSRSVDARPSDAINLALLSGAPLKVADELLRWEDEAMRALEAYPDDAGVIGAEMTSFGAPGSAERLTPGGLAVFDLARVEAARRSHIGVGTGHLLFALVALDGPEARALGVRPTAIENALRQETGMVSANHYRPLTPRTCQVLLRAEVRARGRQDVRATPADLLAALLDEPSGLAARALDEAGVDRQAVRAQLEGR